MPLTGSDILLYEKRNRIVTMTMNRPERLNALTPETRIRIAEGITRFKDDKDALVLILTGAGDKAFCAGADLIDAAEKRGRGEWESSTPAIFSQTAIGNVWKPIIGAINGYALAGGFWMAQLCDVRIAADHAEFGIPEVRWNMRADWISDLTRIIGLGHALELVLWGDRRISAQRAFEMGFVNKVVPRERLMDEAREWAERILHLAPRSVRNLKEILYRAYYMNTEDGTAFATAVEQNLTGMEDSVEGPKAFAEKRKPLFKDR